MSILEAAVLDRRIARSPAQRISLPSVAKAKADQVVALDTRTTVVLAPLKTKASYRTVPIGDTLAATLRDHIVRFAPFEFEPDATLLFTNRLGQPIRRNALGDNWDRARTNLGLPAQARGWHTLRHTYASWLIEAGLSVKTVQARLGHASATETLDVYSHLWPDSDDDTRAAIEQRLNSHQEHDMLAQC